MSRFKLWLTGMALLGLAGALVTFFPSTGRAARLRPYLLSTLRPPAAEPAAVTMPTDLENESGLVAGNFVVGEVSRACYWITDNVASTTGYTAVALPLQVTVVRADGSRISATATASNAQGVSDDGYVVGSCTVDGAIHACVWGPVGPNGAFAGFDVHARLFAEYNQIRQGSPGSQMVESVLTDINVGHLATANARTGDQIASAATEPTGFVARTELSPLNIGLVTPLINEGVWELSSLGRISSHGQIAGQVRADSDSPNRVRQAALWEGTNPHGRFSQSGTLLTPLRHASSAASISDGFLKDAAFVVGRIRENNGVPFRAFRLDLTKRLAVDPVDDVLPSLPGSVGEGTSARDVSDSGFVVGQAQTSQNGDRTGFIYTPPAGAKKPASDGKTMDLNDMVDLNGHINDAVCINNVGTIVGTYSSLTGGTSGYVMTFAPRGRR